MQIHLSKNQNLGKHKSMVHIVTQNIWCYMIKQARKDNRTNWHFLKTQGHSKSFKPFKGGNICIDLLQTFFLHG
jgi:hypothetical protein